MVSRVTVRSYDDLPLGEQTVAHVQAKLQVFLNISSSMWNIHLPFSFLRHTWPNINTRNILHKDPSQAFKIIVLFSRPRWSKERLFYNLPRNSWSGLFSSESESGNYWHGFCSSGQSFSFSSCQNCVPVRIQKYLYKYVEYTETVSIRFLLKYRLQHQHVWSWNLFFVWGNVYRMKQNDWRSVYVWLTVFSRTHALCAVKDM